MLRIINENGRFEIENPEMELRLLETQINADALAKAEQEALMRIYVLGHISDEQRAAGITSLTERLGRCERTVRELMRQGQLRFTAVGRKGYVVTEYDVRLLLGIPVPTPPAALATAAQATGRVPVAASSGRATKRPGKR